MSTARFTTLHPEFGYGIFLSKPTFNVLGSAPNNFLLNSSFKNEQVIAANLVTVSGVQSSSGGVKEVLFPALPSRPIVVYDFDAYSSSQVVLPYEPTVRATLASIPNKLFQVDADVGLDRVVFYNRGYLEVHVFYMILARSR